MASLSVSFRGSVPYGIQTFDLTIELGLGKRAKHCSGKLWIDTENHPVARPLTGQEIIIHIDGSLAFAGVLTQVGDEWLNPVVYKVTFDAIDYTLQLDAKLVTGTFEEQTFQERIEALLTEYAPTFTLGEFESSEDLIPEQKYDYRELSAIFDELAELTSQYFELKFDRSVNFLRIGSPAPICAFNIEGTISISDFVILEDWSDLHNVLVIKDLTIRSAYSIDDTFVIEGVRSFVALAYPPWSAEETVVKVKHGQNPWVTRTSVLDPLGAQSEYEMYRGEGEESAEDLAIRIAALEVERQELVDGTTGDAYVCIWNMGIRFPGVDLPEDGDIIRVSYPFERRDQVLESRDLTSIAVMAARESTDGIHEKVISLPALHAVSLRSATDYAEMLLARGAWPSITGSFQTYTTGWEPGQEFTISSAVRSITDPRPDVGDLRVWVSRVIKTITAVEDDGGTFKIHHEVDFTSQPQAVPIPLDEFLHRIVDQSARISPPGTPPVVVVTTTTTLAPVAYTTSTTMLPRPLLMTKYTELTY